MKMRNVRYLKFRSELCGFHIGFWNDKVSKCYEITILGLRGQYFLAPIYSLLVVELEKANIRPSRSICNFL